MGAGRGLQVRWIELRKRAYRELEPTAWPGHGLSPVNLVLIFLIIAAVMEAVLDTEPTISAGNERILNGMEVGFGIIFLIEYLARVWVAVDNPRYTKFGHPRLHYMLTPLAIIDLLAVVPALFAFGGAPSLVLRFFRVLRMLRLAKLGRTSKAWVLIQEAVYQKRREFTLIMGMVLFTILAAGSLMYWAEGDAQPEKFGSIPRAMWWAIITLTTVGYGDVYPVTALGRILAGIIAISGVMLIALPTGLFAASFTEAMDREQLRAAEEKKLREERRERLKRVKH